MPHSPPGGVPEIGGSSGGFIVLVVALSSFILLASIGIFVLLQRHKDDPFERHARRVLSGQHSQTMYEMPLGPKGMREKFRGLFKFGKMKREGWIRANSAEEDTWDASEDLLPRHSGGTHSRQQDSRDMRWISDSALSQHHKSSVTRSDTSESIQLSAANPRDSLSTLVADFPDSTKAKYTDPFSTSPTSMMPREGAPQIALPGSQENSGGSRPAHLFVNGTRFKESLDL
ncbi:hypothetical protein BDY19DRAFT_919130 [Irpex rosettiformis]|uniref:Uncharacterized protein n=1 Tax=Irpex rosettiformis TaxID=378272 RepID=A0ACB8UJD8_9APHY|nr:hypothetical protein BDY19DRAFT_919130 [Irpex rosettiformis]